MDKKELILTISKEILIAAMKDTKISLDIDRNTPNSGNDLNTIGDRLITIVNKVNAAYETLS